MTLDDLVAAVTKEKLKAGKVLIYNPGRHAPLKVSIWWRQIEGSEIGNGVFGVNLVHHNGKGKTLIYNDDYEAARRGFKYACEHAIVLWAAKTMHPKKSEKLH